MYGNMGLSKLTIVKSEMEIIIMKQYAYVRVSTRTQKLDRQIKNIKVQYPDAIVIQEKFTGTSMAREEWQKLFSRVKEGDTIIFDSVSRMSRNAKEGFTAYEELYNRGINLVFLKEPHINSETYKRALRSNIQLTGDKIDYVLEGINKYLMTLAKEQIEIAFQQAEKEVHDIQARVKEGIEIARMNGKQIGSEKGAKYQVKKGITAKEIISKHSKSFGGDLSDAECMKLAGISNNTFYKYKREIANK